MPPTPYPNAYQIEEMFFNRMQTEKFHTYLADPIDVTVSGQDFHVSGNFQTVEDFHDGVYKRISAAVKTETMKIEISRVIGGGESAVSLNVL